MYRKLCYKNRGKITLYNLTRIEREVYDFVKARGEHGATVTSVAVHIGSSRQNAHIKLSRMVKAGLLKSFNRRYFLERENA